MILAPRDPESLAHVRRRARARSLIGPLHHLLGNFRERMQAALTARGHPLKPALARVVVHLDGTGCRLTELARRAGVSKQAMGRFVDELEELGYVERVLDASDGRARIVRFSETGRVFLRDAVDVVDEIWEEYAALVGEEGLDQLTEGLQGLVGKLQKRRRAPASGA